MNKEIEELLNELKEVTNSKKLSSTYCITNKNWQLLLSYIEQLEKENKILRENAEHNDKVVDKVNWENQQLKKSIKLFTDDLANMTNRALQLEKQKDDVVELIKKQLLSNTNITKYTDEMCLRDVLRMLGEIDVED